MRINEPYPAVLDMDEAELRLVVRACRRELVLRVLLNWFYSSLPVLAVLSVLILIGAITLALLAPLHEWAQSHSLLGIVAALVVLGFISWFVTTHPKVTAWTHRWDGSADAAAAQLSLVKRTFEAARLELARRC
jgi:predicted small integral membrane protein